MRIETLASEHKEAWKPLWRLYLEFYGTSRDDDVYEMTFHRLTDGGNYECEGFIVFCGEDAVGIAHCIYHIHFWQEKRICYMQDLFVDESYRGRGLARGLIERVYTRADDLGLEGVYWNTQEFNDTARRLYDRVAKVTPFIKYKR